MDTSSEPDLYGAGPDDKAVPVSPVTQKTGDPPPYPAQHSPSGAMGTMHCDPQTLSHPGYLNAPQAQEGQFSSQHQTTEGMPMSAITNQPFGVSAIYPSLQQFKEPVIHDGPSSQKHHSDPPQKEQISSVNVHNQTTESPALPTNIVGITAKQSDKDSQKRHVTLDDQGKELSEDEMQQPQTSTPLDVAAVCIQIDWEGKKLPTRWENMLHMGLQSLFNKNFPNSQINLVGLHMLDSFTAKITISPSSACKDLLEEKSAPLKFKDNSEAVVHFKGPLEELPPVAAPLKSYESDTHKLPQIPMTVSIDVDVQKYGDHVADFFLRKFSQYKTGPYTLTVKGTFEKVEGFFKEFSQVVGHSAVSNTNLSEHLNSEQMETNPGLMRVPLFQYWYFNHMYRKDIERIQERHKVNIDADVCVSVKETIGSNSKSLGNASLEFQDLFLKCAVDIESVPVPSVIELARDIQSFNTKLMFNGSGQNWNLVGPPDEVAAAQRMLREDTDRSTTASRDKPQNNNHHRESRLDNPKDIEMNIMDPALSNGICIKDTYREIMAKALQKQITNIKSKFGVEFCEKNVNGDVSVTAQSNDKQKANLEVNAMRALISLYQMVVMSTMKCSLQNSSHHQEKKVKEYLNELREQNPSLVVGEGSGTSGVWMMIGLPDHLRFAVREIEEKFGGHVFDKQHKDMIGYDQDAKYMRPFIDGPAWEGSKVNEVVGWGEEAASGGVYYENINASRAYKEFEGGARGGRVHEPSVDGTAKSVFYGQDGQKLGGAERKETNGFRNDKEGKTEGGFNRHSHDDLTGQPGGANKSGTKEDDKCPICMDEFTNKEKLPCGHGFCKDCLRQCVESMGAKCPVCTKVFGKIEGDQPNGTMTTHTTRSSLPGFGRCGTIVIDYNIPSGIQTSKHPKPGRPFHGAHRTAYLPDNTEGKEVLALLRRAFDQRLIFTVGTSRTSGSDDCVTWNDVHHKTSTHGGPQSFGYPDDTYLKRVREELKAKGIE